MEHILGLVTGIIFGILLQKGQVLRFERQVGFLCLKDMTIIKFMLSAVIVGMIGIYACLDRGVIALDLKATQIAAQSIGGLLFGIGWAIAGFCPGTAVGAVAEGRIHAVWVVIGMLCGAAIYAEIYPIMKRSVLLWGEMGKVTIPQLIGVNHWIVIAIFAIAILALFAVFEKK
ncbi:MAG: YeeE/YedE family protein [Candidatus Omnitrophica bacterium]|nr:YeeE/YedE family protein [Candidatus Omnitrophota bacterium]